MIVLNLKSKAKVNQVEDTLKTIDDETMVLTEGNYMGFN